MALSLANKAIKKGDVAAARALWETAYGKPNQPIEHNGEGAKTEIVLPSKIQIEE